MCCVTETEPAAVSYHFPLYTGETKLAASDDFLLLKKNRKFDILCFAICSMLFLCSLCCSSEEVWRNTPAGSEFSFLFFLLFSFGPARNLWLLFFPKNTTIVLYVSYMFGSKRADTYLKSYIRLFTLSPAAQSYTDKTIYGICLAYLREKKRTILREQRANFETCSLQGISPLIQILVQNVGISA